MLKRIFSYSGQYRKYLVFAALCITAESLFELVIPLIMADIVDIGVASGDRAYIFRQGGIMILAALAALLLGIGSARFSAIAGQGIGANLREAEYAKLQQFSFANVDHFQQSSLVTRMTSDVTNIQNSISSGMRPACRGPVMLVAATAVAFSLNRKLALVFLVALPVLAVCLWLIITNVRPLYAKMQEAIDLVNRIIQENLTAVRVVKAYVRGEYEIGKFNEVNTNLQTQSERAFRLAMTNMAAMQFVMYGTILSILWFGGKMINTGGMQVGELTGFLSYVLQILNSLMMISNIFLMLTRSLASGKRILEIMDEEIDIREDEAEDIEVKRGDIEFRHVYFKYKKDAAEYVLSDINLHIGAGQTVGIVGQTGSAKTTLVQLIPRLYDITSGELLIDGVPVRKYPLKHLRDSIAMVLQNNTLFSGTLRENLLWGDKDATQEEIGEACRIAGADEFIDRLEKGYGTEMGQGGVNVSGGQKQRLCIARAILKKPKVLILDDSTSAVDTATEARIRERLAQKLPHMTKIIIAQRISSVRHADQIIVLEDGKVRGVGTHEELLADNKIYQEIYDSQKEGADL
ncbi:ABC transporter ATP-binding protein [Mediterraneibacter glycyrrhizinilyticus]|uniref:ABC transporter ATP-binding protein n=1 Tax=Mediterraneibacter glycyrrhizinilyticus TaxID=342942 RepID=UPI00195F7340|nr:ABC transporter ATP-binding protein [Mediterraneibacter glycyrrhizinilyticus]MBM6750481.1 ABC transporter ATP-binding protein [Mediterraneibacter glycyrrhizinilyticus]